MKKIKVNWRNLMFAVIAVLSFLFAANSLAVAQESWKRGDEWRGQYKIGDKVQFTISGNQSDFQTCTVTENEPADALMRVNCEVFKHWSAGRYIVYGKDNIRSPQNAKTVKDKKPAKNETEDEETPADETQNNQDEWSDINKWRSGLKVGDKIRVTFSEKPEDFQSCVVTENEPQSVLRVKCNDFKHWKAGVYIVHSESNLESNETQSTSENNRKNTPPEQNGGNSSSLKIGEYACTGSGGRMMIGLGFKVVSGNRYTNLDGDQSGTFSISGGRITFRGGHLDGVVGRDLKDNWFTVASQAQCGPY